MDTLEKRLYLSEQSQAANQRWLYLLGRYIIFAIFSFGVFHKSKLLKIAYSTSIQVRSIRRNRWGKRKNEYHPEIYYNTKCFSTIFSIKTYFNAEAIWIIKITNIFKMNYNFFKDPCIISENVIAIIVEVYGNIWHRFTTQNYIMSLFRFLLERRNNVILSYFFPILLTFIWRLCTA